MQNQDNKTFVETLVETQKNVVDTMVESTRKMANGNTFLNDTAEKGGEWYKNWLENQKSVVSQATEQATTATEGTQQAASKTAEFYQNWYNGQQDWAKRFWDTSTGFVQSAAQAATPNSSTSGNPFEAATSQWSQAMNNMNSMMNGASTMNNWMNTMQSANPFNMDAMKGSSQNFSGFFNQWYEMLNNGFGNLQKGLSNGTSQDAFRNMLNSAEGFTRFSEMMQPMWKSIQEKTFNTEAFQKMMNPAQYQELMDKYFGFLPANVRTHLQQLTTLMQDAAKQSGTAGLNAYQQMRSNMSSAMPMMGGTDAFQGMLTAYQNMQNLFQGAVSPIAKMMTPTAHTKSAAEWSDLLNRMVVFSIKNSELQYMTYQQGSKVMDRLAENITTKIQNGEEINSLMSLYQEWLNLSDATFVQLFESDAYSQLMAEVSGMQLRLKKDVELQMEKALVNVPVATRSELDELYKTIYDLKKQVRELERHNENTPAAATASAAPAMAAAPAATTEAPAATNNDNNAEATASRNAASNGRATKK